MDVDVVVTGVEADEEEEVEEVVVFEKRGKMWKVVGRGAAGWGELAFTCWISSSTPERASGSMSRLLYARANEMMKASRATRTMDRRRCTIVQ